jgi:hypothetical protein
MCKILWTLQGNLQVLAKVEENLPVMFLYLAIKAAYTGYHVSVVMAVIDMLLFKITVVVQNCCCFSKLRAVFYKGKKNKFGKGLTKGKKLLVCFKQRVL